MTPHRCDQSLAHPTQSELGGRLTPIGLALLALIVLMVARPAPVAAQAAESGTVSGRLFDGQDRSPISDATVILDFSEPEDGSIPRQLVATSGPAGDFEFDEAVPVGFYGLSFVKAGYRASAIANFEVKAGEENFIEFPMPRQVVSESGDVMELEAYVVEASVVGELMNNLELRLESDQLVNLLSAEDLSKFAASDVADAIKRVAGVNVVEGQFAIIRGLEDRYSSTLYNGAPVPSPDPDRQSVQLDLFPSDVVNNLQLSKSFSAYSPSNSSGGSIDIVTHSYPEELTFKFAAGTGFNERTLDEFLRLDKGSPIGVPEDGDHTIESDFSALFGGRTEAYGRELRFKVVVANEIDFQTAVGSQGEAQPRFAATRGRERSSGGLALGVLDRTGPRFDFQQSERTEQRTYYVGAGIDFDEDGKHRVDGSFFRTEKKDEVVQLRENGAIPGFDYANFNETNADRLQGSYQRSFRDHWILDYYDPGENFGTEQGKHAFFAPVAESRTFDRDRTLSVYQLNGEHDLDVIDEGLKLTWAANHARTDQSETTFNVRYSFNTVENFVSPNDEQTIPSALPITSQDLVGRTIAVARNDLVFGQNDIEEIQYFGRIDLEYEFEPHSDVLMVARTGYWFEQASREVTSTFELQPFGVAGQPGVFGAGQVPQGNPDSFDTSSSSGGGSAFTVIGDNPIEMGRRLFLGAGLNNPDSDGQESNTKRRISAWSGELKATLFEDLDVVAGLRLENLRITAENDPYTGFCGPDEFVDRQCPDPSIPPNIFPGRFLFLDRIDNPLPGSQGGDGAPDPPNTPFNDQLLGISLPMETIVIPPGTPGVTPGPRDVVDCNTRECLDSVLRGEIDEFFVLPSVSTAYRPFDGWTVRFAYSQTVARPSFRELAYYASQESGSDDFFVGNPQLTTSDVESIDGRIEWTFGDFGDLFALSVFYKTIQDPIEQVVLIDPQNADCTGACVFRTFRNNENEAELLGMEVEGRRTLDFIGGDLLGGFFETISIGGNFTYIDAEVERSPFEIARTEEPGRSFFDTIPEDVEAGRVRFDGLEKKRRLFGQPEWIANADISLDHPDWGTKATLSIFAISEILDAVGAADLDNQGGVEGYTLDRYLDKYYQLDLVLSQAFAIPRMPGEFTAKASIKNLTDTTRKVIYDQDQTIDDIPERSFKVGRDYSFSIGYTLTY